MQMSGKTMSGEMGGMSMVSGRPDLVYLQKSFWAAVGAAIALATVVNIYNKFLYRQRCARFLNMTTAS